MVLKIKKLKEVGELVNALLDNLVSAVFILDKNFRIRSFNHSFQALCRKPGDKIPGERFGIVLGCAYAVEEEKDCGNTSKCGNCRLNNSLGKALTQEGPANRERMNRRFYIHGREVRKYFLYSAKRIFLDNQEMILVIVDDMTGLMEAGLKLKQTSVIDGLTKLSTHKQIYYKLEEELGRARRYGNKLSVMMLDIDNFKAINDTYGHHTGDKTLAEVGGLIKGSLRDIDHAGRYGGEEFMVILPQTGLQDARITAERIRKAVETKVFAGLEQKLTLSGGVAGYREETPLALINKAETLLYLAKQKGKNRIEGA